MNKPPVTEHPRWARVGIEVGLFLLALMGGAIFLGIRLEGTPAPTDGQVALDLLLGLVAVALVPFRKRWPLAIAIAATACMVGSTFSIVAFLIIVGSLATRRRIRDLYVMGPLMLLAVLIPLIGTPLREWPASLISGVVSFGLFWLGGAYLGARRALLTTAQDRAATLEREQAMRLTQAKTAERTRIAQEMHDVLAHRISLIAVHANVLAYRDDLTREQTKEHAKVVREAAEKAVAELADVLGVLRGGEGADNTAPPQPTLDRLPDLIADSRSAGTAVAVIGRMPDLDELPEDTSRTTYRILQECLTNARKHATGQPVTISITGEEGSHLALEVRNPAATSANIERSADSNPTTSTPRKWPARKASPRSAGFGDRFG